MLFLKGGENPSLNKFCAGWRGSFAGAEWRKRRIGVGVEVLWRVGGMGLGGGGGELGCGWRMSGKGRVRGQECVGG
jgi:hypothetical protein